MPDNFDMDEGNISERSDDVGLCESKVGIKFIEANMGEKKFFEEG